jgi:glutathione-regulated potassium-efflux system protein KefB
MLGELSFLPFALVLLTAAVASVPLARRLGLSAIVAYLIAGIVIGPFGLGLVQSPERIVGVSELGIVLLMFLIGLELELSRLLAMRREIFGLGAAQLALTTVVIGGLAWACGFAAWRGALVLGLSLALSATAIALEILEERHETQQVYGQRAFAILLFQDMAVVPILALLPLLGDGGAGGAGAHQTGLWPGAVLSVAKIGAAIALLVIAGRYLLNPFFRLLATTGSREVMTAAALLVVLGAALLMQSAGMSMALGAFLAGVLLAESTYRHELEADIEPFRGLLLALFFMGVGMTIDMGVVGAHLWLILGASVLVTALKIAVVWLLFRPTCTDPATSLRAGSVLTGAGEFAFVLVPLGATLGVLGATQAGVVTAIAAVTMLIGPPVAALTDFALHRFARRSPREADDFSDARGSVLMIGFGRFGQIVAQCLLAQELDVTTIDTDPLMIQNAARFGFKIYYGDGTRLDVLRAAGAAKVRLIAVCIDDREAADRMVELIKAEFPEAKLYVRSYDRGHTLALLARNVDYELRETFESALVFGRKALEGCGVEPEAAAAIEADVRSRDLARLAVQRAEGIYAGLDLLRGPQPRPEPLTEPEQPATPLNEEAAEIIEEDKEMEHDAEMR